MVVDQLWVSLFKLKKSDFKRSVFLRSRLDLLI